MNRCTSRSHLSHLFIGCDAHANEPFNGGDQRPLTLPLGRRLAGLDDGEVLVHGGHDLSKRGLHE